jgi:GNAT superfamily N-acetyltransferase
MKTTHPGACSMDPGAYRKVESRPGISRPHQMGPIRWQPRSDYPCPVGAALVRQAKPGDGVGMAHVWVDMGEHLVDLNPMAFQVPQAVGLVDWFEQDLRQPPSSTASFVADEAGEVVGMIGVRIEPPLEDAPKQVLRELSATRGTIEFLGVLRSRWRCGIGTRLVEVGEAWLLERGATVLSVDTYIASPVSVPFYEAAGYRRRSIQYRKPPEQGAPPAGINLPLK